MMMGTRERERISRHTSMPEIFRSITSSRISAGRRRVEAFDRFRTVGGRHDEEALTLERDESGVAYGLARLDTVERRVVVTAADGCGSDRTLRRDASGADPARRDCPEDSGIDVVPRDPLPFTVPIIMVTARIPRSTPSSGSRSARDDYVSKPFRLRELIARGSCRAPQDPDRRRSRRDRPSRSAGGR